MAYLDLIKIQLDKNKNLMSVHKKVDRWMSNSQILSKHHLKIGQSNRQETL